MAESTSGPGSNGFRQGNTPSPLTTPDRNDAGWGSVRKRFGRRMTFTDVGAGTARQISESFPTSRAFLAVHGGIILAAGGAEGERLTVS